MKYKALFTKTQTPFGVSSDIKEPFLISKKSNRNEIVTNFNNIQITSKDHTYHPKA